MAGRLKRVLPLHPAQLRSRARLLASAVALCAAAMTLSGCGGLFHKKGPVVPESDVPAGTIYGKANKLLDKHDYAQAAKKYEDVDINHPYSDQARHAIVMAEYAYYKAGKYTEAISSGNRYLTLHPGAPDAPLAQNLIAMSYYVQVLDPQRDQTYAERALKAYKTLLQRYPTCRYATQAANRVRILRNLLAANEMMIGRYYLRNHDYLAAINRFRNVVTRYQTTQQIQEALSRLTEAYLALGVVGQAETAAAVLGHNYPDSSWYKHAYTLLQRAGDQPREHPGSWITQIWKGKSA